MSDELRAGCEHCRHFTMEDLGEDYSSYWIHGCELKPTIANLKSFPFKKQQPCFILGFWSSEFSEGDLDEDKDYNEAYKKYAEKYLGKL